MPMPRIVPTDSTQTHNPSRFNDATIKAYGDSFAGMHQKGLWDDYELPAIANTPVPGYERDTWKDYVGSKISAVPDMDTINTTIIGYGEDVQTQEELLDLMIQLYTYEIEEQTKLYDENYGNGFDFDSEEQYGNLMAILNCMDMPYFFGADHLGALYNVTNGGAFLNIGYTYEINNIIKETGILDKFYDYLNGKSWEESGLSALFEGDPEEAEEHFINNMLLYADPDDLGEGYDIDDLPKVKQKLLGMLDKGNSKGIYSFINSFDEKIEAEQKAKSNLYKLKMGKYNAEILKKLYPFLKVQEADGFEEYLERDYELEFLDLPRELRKVMPYLQQEEVAIYVYLYENESADRASEYLDAMQDMLNQRIGLSNALEKVQDLNDIGSIPFFGNITGGVYSGTIGLRDGVRNFCDGVIDSMTVDGEINAFEYETMFKMQLLSEDGEITSNLSDAQKATFKWCYETFQSVGNMLIPVAASFIPVVGQAVGVDLFFVSIAGNSAESAAQRGLPIGKSYLYGAINGFSETMTEVFLGGITGISEKTGLKAILGEGEEEFFQGWFGGILDSVFFHEPFDFEETMKGSLYAGCQGMLVSGIMQGGTAVALSGGDVALSFTDSEFNSMAELLHSLDVKYSGKILDSQMISGIMQLDDSNPLKKFTINKINKYVADLTPADLAYLSNNLSNNLEVKGMTTEQFHTWLKSLTNEQLCSLFGEVGKDLVQQINSPAAESETSDTASDVDPKNAMAGDPRYSVQEINSTVDADDGSNNSVPVSALKGDQVVEDGKIVPRDSTTDDNSGIFMAGDLDAEVTTIEDLKTVIESYDAKNGKGAGLSLLFDCIYGKGDIYTLSNGLASMDKKALTDNYYQLCAEAAKTNSNYSNIKAKYPDVSDECIVQADILQSTYGFSLEDAVAISGIIMGTELKLETAQRVNEVMKTDSSIIVADALDLINIMDRSESLASSSKLSEPLNLADAEVVLEIIRRTGSDVTSGSIIDAVEGYNNISKNNISLDDVPSQVWDIAKKYKLGMTSAMSIHNIMVDNSIDMVEARVVYAVQSMAKENYGIDIDINNAMRIYDMMEIQEKQKLYDDPKISNRLKNKDDVILKMAKLNIDHAALSALGIDSFLIDISSNMNDYCVNLTDAVSFAYLKQRCSQANIPLVCKQAAVNNMSIGDAIYLYDQVHNNDYRYNRVFDIMKTVNVDSNVALCLDFIMWSNLASNITDAFNYYNNVMATEINIDEYINSDFRTKKRFSKNNVGVDQHAVATVMDAKFGDIKLRNALIEQVRSKTGLDKAGAIKFLNTMEGKTNFIDPDIQNHGICNYSDVANSIFNWYEKNSNPEQFKKDFGFDMYYKGEWNGAQLLTDMWIYFNKGRLIDSNGNVADLNWNYQYLAESYTRLRGAYVMSFINQYLADHGFDTSNNYQRTIINDYEGPNVKEYYDFRQKMLTIQISEALENGEHVSIGAQKGLPMYNQNDDYWKPLGGAHIMSVYGINSNGEVYVDSWKIPYMIPIGNNVPSNLHAAPMVVTTLGIDLNRDGLSNRGGAVPWTK